MANIKANFEQINRLARLLKKDMTLRVGIIGSQASAIHKDTNLTNAQLGAIHEFGSISNNIPRRSFLWDSLVHKLNLNKEEAREFRKYIWLQIFEKGSIENFYKALGSKALQAIEEGFATNGFGEWPPLSPLYQKRKEAKDPFYKRYKNTPMAQWLQKSILTDTGQLRHSISFRIIKK